MDVSFLNQVGSLIFMSDFDTSIRENSQSDEYISTLGLEGSDLSDYLRDMAELDAFDVGLIPTSLPPLI